MGQKAEVKECKCPERWKNVLVGPHFHMLAFAEDLQPGDMPSFFYKITKVRVMKDRTVWIDKEYEGGATAQELVAARQEFAITRPRETPST